MPPPDAGKTGQYNKSLRALGYLTVGRWDRRTVEPSDHRTELPCIAFSIPALATWFRAPRRYRPMSTVVELPKANAADTRRLYTYAELVAELPESNQPGELWTES